MIDKENLPRHIAIIMDGNGRWAQQKRLPRTAGHRVGMQRVKEIIKAAKECGIEVMTLFAFSAENWSRPEKEIKALMRYFGSFLDAQLKDMLRQNIKFKVIGREDPLPAYILDKIKNAQERTAHNTAMTLVIAVNYGSRQEIIDGIRKIIALASQGKLGVEGVNEGSFKEYLYTADLPDPDLLIRTSGEQRISNFLLWQLSYTELYFAKKLWPDFRTQDLHKAIKEYQKRQRRYGAVSH